MKRFTTIALAMIFAGCAAKGPVKDKEVASVAATSWLLLESRDTYKLRLITGGQAVLFTGRAPVVPGIIFEDTVGSWSQEGASITLSFRSVTYKGTINGDVMSGTATGRGTEWIWEARRLVPAGETKT